MARSCSVETLVIQVCKHFLDVVEKKQYGSFWVCPNGCKDCHYRHALPPGHVLKSQTKASLEEETDEITTEEEIENQVEKAVAPGLECSKTVSLLPEAAPSSDLEFPLGRCTRKE